MSTLHGVDFPYPSVLRLPELPGKRKAFLTQSITLHVHLCSGHPMVSFGTSGGRYFQNLRFVVGFLCVNKHWQQQ